MRLYANNNFIVVVDGTQIKAQFVKSRFNFTYKKGTFSLFDDAHRKFGVKSGTYGIRNQADAIFADDLSLLNYLTALRLEAGGSNKADLLNGKVPLEQMDESIILDYQLNAAVLPLQNHASSTSNPHGTTKAQVGLGKVDNTSDVDKPVSTAVSNALKQKADLVGSYVNPAQIQQPISGGLTAVFNGRAASTNLETFLSLTIAANDARLKAGSIFLIRVFGTQSQAAVSNTVTFDVDYNSTKTIASGTVATGSAAQTNRGVLFEAIVTFYSVGAKGKITGSGKTEVSGVLPVISQADTAPFDIDTTADVVINLRCANRTANASNVIRVTNAMIMQMK